MDTTPAIVALVMRIIGVADVNRSVSFYRDILGFEVRELAEATEAVYGPARIRFERAAPEKSATLFFQTNDVEVMHSAILGRGGAPSDWFGQSYDKPHSQGALPMMLQALPQLPCDDVAAAVALPKTERHTGIWLRIYLRGRCGETPRGIARERRQRAGRAGKPSVGAARFRRD